MVPGTMPDNPDPPVFDRIPMSEPSFPPPVLILTPPGLPGQTLAAALGQNPVGYDVPELNLEQAPSTDQLQRDLIGFRGMQILGLMRAVAQLYGGEQSGIAVEMARRWLNARAHLPTAHVAREIAAHIAPRRMFAPVTAALFDRLNLKHLLTIFPEAVYVQLTVHPLTYGKLLSRMEIGDVMLTITGAVDETVEPAEPDPQQLWLMAQTALDEVAAQVPEDRILTQDAAQLASDPRAALGALAGALGMPADTSALKAMLDPEASVFAGPGPLGAPIAGNIQGFSRLAKDFAAIAPAGRLDGPVPWRPDGTGLSPQVRSRAEALGYH
jgi:hypothetical protein